MKHIRAIYYINILKETATTWQVFLSGHTCPYTKGGCMVLVDRVGRDRSFFQALMNEKSI